MAIWKPVGAPCPLRKRSGWCLAGASRQEAKAGGLKTRHSKSYPAVGLSRTQSPFAAAARCRQRWAFRIRIGRQHQLKMCGLEPFFPISHPQIQPACVQRTRCHTRRHRLLKRRCSILLAAATEIEHWRQLSLSKCIPMPTKPWFMFRLKLQA